MDARGVNFVPALAVKLTGSCSGSRLASVRKKAVGCAQGQRSTLMTGTRMCEERAKCVRCGKRFRRSENKAGSCVFHGDIVGNIMEYNLYEDHHFDDASLDGVKGPRYGRRWACCQDTDADAPPCKSGVHVTFDCDSARWAEGISFVVK